MEDTVEGKAKAHLAEVHLYWDKARGAIWSNSEGKYKKEENWIKKSNFEIDRRCMS